MLEYVLAHRFVGARFLIMFASIRVSVLSMAGECSGLGRETVVTVPVSLGT